MNKLIRKSECRISLAVDTTACSMKMAAAKSLANRNRRYLPTTRELSNVFTELDKTSVTQETNYVDIKASKSPHLSKVVKVLIVAGVITVVSSIITVVVILNREGDEGEKPIVPPENLLKTTDTLSSRPTDETSTSFTSTESREFLWSAWGEWTQCTYTCNSGIHKRYRRCNADDFSLCLGDFVEIGICQESTCPVHGRWSTWTLWGSCDVTCGGGTQTRTRKCIKTESSELACAGNISQAKTCSNWKCPDCSATCTVGILNSDCDTCVCDGTVITGRVLAESTWYPVSNAALYASTAPTKLLTMSNSTGFFTLNDTCTTTELFVTREGFVDKVAAANHSILEIKMHKLVLPFLTETPQSKSRLTGENVTLCCEANGNPSIEYFEWTKDEILLDHDLFQNGDKLTLFDLTTSNSGKYQCRANSPVGAIMSPVAILTVKETSGDFCADALQQKTILLPDDCVQTATSTATYNVGECVSKNCRQETTADAGTCWDDILSCCTIGEAALETVQCSGYDLEIIVVRSCSCAGCTSNSLTITGTALGLEDRSPVKFGEVLANGVLQGYTSISGSFQFQTSRTSSKLTINLRDTYFNHFLQAVKVIEITDDIRVLHVDIRMTRAAAPVEIDSNIENTIIAGNNVTTPTVQISIPANAFYYSNGTKYDGTVEARITFLDPTNTSVSANIPGVFQFVNGEGQTGNLASLAVFNLDFEDTKGKALVLDEVIDLYVPIESSENVAKKDLKLWNMNSETGVWEYVTPGTGIRRRKRQYAGVLVGEIDWSTVTVGRWYNYDYVYKITDRPCYFKVRLYKDKELMEHVVNPDRKIRVSYHILDNNVLKTISFRLMYPETQCFPGICDNNVAYFSLYFDGDKTLYAGEPQVGSSKHYYAITDSEKALKIQMTESINGPFYQNEAKCLVSKPNSFYLRFHYGKTYEGFIFNEMYNFLENNDFNHNVYVSQRTWYPKRKKEGIRACFIKVRLLFARDIYLSPGQYINLKAISYGGTNEIIQNFTLGIKVYDFNNVNENSTYCIEYKCSGTIDPYFEFAGNQSDNTRVVLSLTYPSSEIQSEVTDEADFVSFNLKLSNHAQQGSTTGTYEIYAPVAVSPSLGIYDATDSQNDANNARDIAKHECRSGKQHNFNDDNPDIGVAVTFSLRNI